MKKKQPAPYKMGDLIQITKRLCSDKVQPRVKVGTYYLVLASDKIKSGATVLKVAEFGKMAREVLVRPKENIDPKDMVRINEERFEWKRKDKKEMQAKFTQFKEEFQKKQEEKEEEFLKAQFTEQERIQMAYHPYMYAELAWHYAEQAMELGRQMKIEKLKKVSRLVRSFRVEFNCELRKSMTQNVIDYAREKVMNVIEQHRQSFFIFFTTVKNEINRQQVGIELDEVKAYAYMAILCYKCQRRLDQRNVEIIRQRLGQGSQHESFKYMKELNKCMETVMDGVKIENTIPILTVVKTLEKYIGGMTL